ncbi:MAG: hypothetical protein LBM16_02160, partial [Clostridiales bacterium]|nr:hypothetical protein [Clostridiales bacterium]
MIKIRKIFLFFKNLFISIKENGLITHANELSYKLCLAFFPFIIFLLSLLSFLKISSNYFLEDIVTNLPESVSALISVFIEEITAKHTKSHAGLLSGSL